MEHSPRRVSVAALKRWVLDGQPVYGSDRIFKGHVFLKNLRGITIVAASGLVRALSEVGLVPVGHAMGWGLVSIVSFRAAL